MVKIRSLELENVKRVKALTLTPNETGLTIIGGDNRQGKTSVLDAICFALGGEKYRPSNLQREGSMAEAMIRLQLDNGLIVERKGKNAALKVTDPSGQKAGQSLLDSFVEAFALDLPKFLNASSKDKAKTLLKIIGLESVVDNLEKKEAKIFNERHGIGVVADRKKKFADEMPFHADAPEAPVSASEIMEKQKAVLERNAENDRLRRDLQVLKVKDVSCQSNVEALSKQLSAAKQEAQKVRDELRRAEAASENLQDESTAELEAELAKLDDINAKVRANLDKSRAVEDAAKLAEDYAKLTAELEETRKSRMELLNGANMPLPGLSVENGELTFNGKAWDCMSGAEQLLTATAIVQALNPKCQFVLLDGLEQMDLPTLQEFGAWLEGKNLQAIATRVSKGGECSIVIEDGMEMKTEDAPAYKAGEF